jgi:hypothetical protein
MPISQAFLAQRTNSHLLVSAKMSIGEAFTTFEAAGGESWWVIVIDYDEHRYGLLWLMSLAMQMGLLGSGPPDWKGTLLYDAQVRFWRESTVLIGSIDPSAMLKTVERRSLSDQEAWLLAETAPGWAVVVLDARHYVGLVNNRLVVEF